MDYFGSYHIKQLNENVEDKIKNIEHFEWDGDVSKFKINVEDIEFDCKITNNEHSFLTEYACLSKDYKHFFNRFVNKKSCLYYRKKMVFD